MARAMSSTALELTKRASGMAAAALPRHDGAAFASSLDVARVFGKKPMHVNRRIRELIAATEDQSNFGLISYLDEYRREQEAFELTRDGFTLLAMGFTGAKALRFKLAYIAKFNAMEAELRQ